jgi:hypothetical protein
LYLENHSINLVGDKLNCPRVRVKGLTFLRELGFADLIGGWVPCQQSVLISLMKQKHRLHHD